MIQIKGMKKSFIVITAAAALFAVILIAVLVNISIRQKRGFEALLEETRRNAESVSLLDRTVQRIGEDSNEVRSLLSLDPVHYSTTPYIDESSEDEDRFGVFISALKSFDDHYKSIEHTNQVAAFFKEPSLRSALDKFGLTAQPNGAAFSIAEKNSTDEHPLFSGGWDGTRCTIDSRVTGERYAGVLEADSVATYLSKELQNVRRLRSEYAAFKKSFESWTGKPQTMILLDDFKLVLELANPAAYEKRLTLRTSDYREIGNIVESEGGKVEFASREWDSLDALFKDFPNVISQIDIRSFGAIKTDEMVAALTSAFADEEFKSVLEAYDMDISLRQREDSDFVYFDINKSGDHYGAFGVLKEHGELYILDADDVPISSVESIDASSLFSDSSDDQKKKNQAKADSISTVLLCGSHEKNPDTMILFVSDNATKEAFLFSLPRDIFYKGQKINNIYRHFGPEQFLKDLSDITGLSIDTYVNIDMYAFIDIINIIGGIEVTLSEPLIDPTYRIKENGLWKTLYYDKGTHHLDGFGALRIARSRHTSSDFERAERQQLIIASLMDKFSATAKTDVPTMYKLMQTAFKYVSTNISPIDAVKLAGELTDITIRGKYVLSTGNVLYHTTSPSGLWILLPKDDNWDTIATFIQSKLQFSN